MQSYFFWDTQFYVAFQFWETETTLQYVITFIALCCIGIVYEYLVKLEKLPNMIVFDDAAVTEIDINESKRFKRFWLNVKQTILHIAKVAVGYFLMLEVMTFNVALILPCMTGYTIGYLLHGAYENGNITEGLKK